MTKFNTSKNKIRQTFHRNNKNINSLEVKRNIINNFFKEKQKIKSIKTLFESEWIATTPTATASVRNITKGKDLAELVSIEFEEEITILEEILPFINVDIMVKTPPDSEPVGFLEYDQETFESDFVEVRGDTNLIYQGIPRPLKFQHDEDALDDGDFQRDYAKKVFTAAIEYTDGADEYRVVGTLIRIRMIDDLGTGCNNQDFDTYDCFVDVDFVGSKNYAEFLELESNSANMIVQKEESRFTTNSSPPPDCIQNDTVIDEQEITFPFTGGAIDRYLIRMFPATRFKKVGGSFVLDTTGDFEIDSDAVTVTSRSFQFVGYWLFYSDNKDFFFGVDEDGEGELELKNLPTNPDQPWNQITFKLNQEPHPEALAATVTQTGSRKQLFFRKNAPSTFNTYKVFLTDTLVLKAPSSLISDTEIFDVFDDVYNKDSTDYTRVESHSTKTENIYVSKKHDIEYKIKITVKNPFYWEELRRYKINET